MIFFTGDLHGDKARLSQLKKAKVKKGDTVIVCGDFGFVWDGSDKEKKLLKKIGSSKYNLLFIDGYNDNHKLINTYPTVDLFGGQARQIEKNLYALKRGEIYTIEGKRIFAFGGGDSGNTEEGEINELSLATLEETQRAKQKLLNLDKKVDAVVTYEAPAKLRSLLAMSDSGLNHMHAFLEWVNTEVSYNAWYMGKYHVNRDIPQKYHLLFTDVVAYKEK